MKDRRSRSGKTLGQDTILSMVDHASGTIFQHIGDKQEQIRIWSPRPVRLDMV